ncbi:MAG: hypothetical protein MK434_03025, partial [SAR324 cluster bacterium]|nr:hypothetical protein [SAR324 cluster bacterium]
MSRLRYHIRILFVAILLLNLCGLISLQAQTGELRRPFQAVRNLGMGNTGIALSFDENALFYNPAGLVGVDAILVGFPFLLEISEDSANMYNEIRNLGSNPKTEEVVELLMGKRVHFRTLTNINVIMPFGELVTLGGARGLEFQLDLGVRNPVAIEIDFGLRLDRITNLGFGLPVARGRWLFGAGIESVERCDIPLTTATIGTVLS